MNSSTLPKFIGVLVSLFCIWLITEFTLVDLCVQQGGNFDYRKGQCVLENGEVFKSGLETPMVFVYVVVAFSVTFIVARLLTRKKR